MEKNLLESRLIYRSHSLPSNLGRGATWFTFEATLHEADRLRGAERRFAERVFKGEEYRSALRVSQASEPDNLVNAKSFYAPVVLTEDGASAPELLVPGAPVLVYLRMLSYDTHLIGRPTRGVSFMLEGVIADRAESQRAVAALVQNWRDRAGAGES